MSYYFFCSGYGDHRDLHVLTHSFPTRRSSDLAGGFDPVGNPRIAMREHDRARTIGRDPGAVLVDVNVVVAIVQRLHPDRKSTRLNSSHYCASRMPSSA